MCGRYSLAKKPGAVAEAAGVGATDVAPRFNIAPTQVAPVIRRRDHRAEWLPMRWGLIPSWSTDASGAAKSINARAETLAQKPTFRSALQSRRCLVPADGFFEWEKREGQKFPIRFVMKDGAPFALAGLWESWHSPETAEPWLTFTIITTSANAVVKPYHDRMPVILPPDRYEAWLDCHDPKAAAPEVLGPYPAEEMRSFPVTPRLNNALYDAPDCLVPWKDPALRQADFGF